MHMAHRSSPAWAAHLYPPKGRCLSCLVTEQKTHHTRFGDPGFDFQVQAYQIFRHSLSEVLNSLLLTKLQGGEFPGDRPCFLLNFHAVFHPLLIDLSIQLPAIQIAKQGSVEDFLF